MALLTLYHDDAPGTALDSVTVGATPMTVGREPGPGGWCVGEGDRAVSRVHFKICEVDGRLWVEDLSANGLAVAAGPLAARTPTVIAPGETLRFGRLRVTVREENLESTVFRSPFAPAAEGLSRPAVEPARPATAVRAAADPTVFDSPFVRPLLAPVDAAAAAALEVPSDWAPAPARPAAAVPASPAAAASSSDAALLEAFCRGAKLDMSAFAGEDPVATMSELGAVYRQMVLGLSDLMSARISVKTEYRMTRTTVHAQGNNPFKWAPAQRVAVDLLRPRRDGFLGGAAAVNDSFTDLKKHLLAMLAGFREAVSSTLAELEPQRAEARAESRGFSLKTRGQAAWEAYGALHAEFAAEAQGDADGRVNRSFREGYEQSLLELDAAAPSKAAA